MSLNPSKFHSIRSPFALESAFLLLLGLSFVSGRFRIFELMVFCFVIRFVIILLLALLVVVVSVSQNFGLFRIVSELLQI